MERHATNHSIERDFDIAGQRVHCLVQKKKARQNSMDFFLNNVNTQTTVIRSLMSSFVLILLVSGLSGIHELLCIV